MPIQHGRQHKPTTTTSWKHLFLAIDKRLKFPSSETWNEEKCSRSEEDSPNFIGSNLRVDVSGGQEWGQNGGPLWTPLGDYVPALASGVKARPYGLATLGLDPIWQAGNASL